MVMREEESEKLKIKNKRDKKCDGKNVILLLTPCILLSL